jgi:hypothetical protein
MFRLFKTKFENYIFCEKRFIVRTPAKYPKSCKYFYKKVLFVVHVIEIFCLFCSNLTVPRRLFIPALQ